MNKGRPVKVSIKVNKEGVGVFETHEARFHVWGFRKGKTDPKVTTMETVGVCELPGGTIRLVQPERIQFMDQAVK